VRGGTEQYRALHSDIGASRVPPALRADWPPPKVAVNFAVQDVLSTDFGPMRLVPRRKVLRAGPDDLPPCFAEEPAEMRRSKVCPMRAGTALIRDFRLWHGGTPNQTSETRFLPNVELVSAAYSDFLRAPHSFSPSAPRGPCRSGRCAIPPKERQRSLCPTVFATLSPACRAHCEGLVADAPGAIPRGIRPDFARLQESYAKGTGRKGKGVDAGRLAASAVACGSGVAARAGGGGGLHSAPY